MTWTILNLQRTPPRSRCCFSCNPELAQPFSAANKKDPRLSTFANDFLYPLASLPSRPNSSASVHTTSSAASDFVPQENVKVSADESNRLRSELIDWRDLKHVAAGSPLFLSSQIFFPPKQLEMFIKQSGRFLSESHVTVRLLKKLIPWDSASDADLADLVDIINEWREAVPAQPQRTPTSQRRASKKAWPTAPTTPPTGVTTSPTGSSLTPQRRPIPQPDFIQTRSPTATPTTSDATPRARPMPQPLPRPHFAPPTTPSQPHIHGGPSTHLANANVFATPQHVNQWSQSHFSYTAGSSGLQNPSPSAVPYYTAPNFFTPPFASHTPSPLSADDRSPDRCLTWRTQGTRYAKLLGYR